MTYPTRCWSAVAAALMVGCGASIKWGGCGCAEHWMRLGADLGIPIQTGSAAITPAVLEDKFKSYFKERPLTLETLRSISPETDIACIEKSLMRRDHWRGVGGESGGWVRLSGVCGQLAGRTCRVAGLHRATACPW